MRRTFIFALAVAFCLTMAAAALAHQVTHEIEVIGFDGTILHHNNGVRIGDFDARFDDAQGLTYLQFRLAPKRGTVKLLDWYILVDGKVAYQRTSVEPLNFDLSYLESPTKHWEQTVFFTPPVKGFNYTNGAIQWQFLVDGKKYLVTWTMKDNEVKTNIVTDTPVPAAAPAPAAAPVETPAAAPAQ
jgi:hypothetical protein